MVLMTQHYDTVQAVGARSKATIMMVPYAPTGMSSVSDQIAQAMLITQSADAMAAADDEPAPAPAKPRPPRPAQA